MVVEEQVNEVTGAVETIVKSVYPYEYTGHAGYWFDGGKTIHGFGPDGGDMTSTKAVMSLKSGATYPGQITDDTSVFQKVANGGRIDRDAVPQTVYELPVSMTPEDYAASLKVHQSLPID